MQVEKNNIITLSNQKKYFVVETTSINGKNYVCLAEENNPKSVKICKEEKENDKLKLIVVDNEGELVEVSMRFMETIVSELKENEENNV